PQSITGSYSITLNPTITNTVGDLIDQNQNGTPGEIPGDRFTGTFSIGSGGGGQVNNFGYRWAGTPLDPALNIQPGQPNVVTFTAISTVDDVSAPLSLGTNTFNFYGITYNTINVSTNGLISLNQTDATFTNSDLTTTPTEPVFAPFWDDLHTGRN